MMLLIALILITGLKLSAWWYVAAVLWALISGFLKLGQSQFAKDVASNAIPTPELLADINRTLEQLEKHTQISHSPLAIGQFRNSWRDHPSKGGGQ